ncbi:hypothetical protein Tco_0746970 [Tanacetum coccineum]
MVMIILMQNYSLIESVLYRDNMISSPKIDFLLEEFAGERALIAPIPPGIVEANFDPKGDILSTSIMLWHYLPYVSSVSLEVVEIVIPEVGGIDTDILLTIKDDILREKLLNVIFLLLRSYYIYLKQFSSSLDFLKDNATSSLDFVTKSSSTSLNFFLEETNTFDNSLPESETFCFNLEEISSGSPTFYLDLSLPDYEAFFYDCEPDSGNFTIDVKFLPHDEFSISFIRDPPFPVIDTLLPFSFENENKVVNPGILAAGEEKSPHLSSHRGLRALNESPLMISGEDTTNLDVPLICVRIKQKSQEKRSKPDKHGHGKRKSTQEPGECYQKSTQVNLWSTKVNSI